MSPPPERGSRAEHLDEVEVPPREKPRLGSRFRPVLVLVIIEAAFLAAVYGLASRYAPPWVLTAMDCIALPGADAVLGVRIHARPPFSQSSPAGVELDFHGVDAEGGELEPKPLGSSAVGLDGVAHCAVRAPLRPGVFRYVARVRNTGKFRFERDEEEILLQVVPADRPILIVGIPQAISSDEASEAAATARERLASLERRAAVAYLAARERDSPRRLGAWLERLGLPSGAVLVGPIRKGREHLGEVLPNFEVSKWKCVVFLRPPGSLRVSGLSVFSAQSWSEARKLIEEKG
ncbi:MAG TPA: hypothetical protein VMT52_11035 [Planctomycetota bacterium]|nr:hypothetical protein [Planctomycetota bacterium]